MEKINSQPINGVIEPDFLQYLTKTFKDWNKLHEDKTTLGTREISKMQWILYGAKCNARFGFEVIAKRHTAEGENEEHFTVLIYKNKEEMESGEPLYCFDTPIYR